MLKLFAGLALACLVTPALADDCSGQVKRLLAAAHQHKEPLLADFKVAGAPYDREIILGYRDGIEFIWFFDKGCLVSHPVVLGPKDLEPNADDPSTPPDSPPSAPPPTSPSSSAGQELGI